MSDDVKVGDRFEHSRTGGIAVCTGAQVTDSERYPCEFQARGEKPYPAECYLNEPYWRRIPREAPTIEERRAALKVGEVIKDPALLCKGMRVYTGVRPSGFDRVVARMSKQVVTFADGGQFGYDSIQRGRQDWERIEFLGWAQEEKTEEIRYTTTNHELGCTARPCVCGAKPVEAVAETFGGNAGSTCMKCYWQGGVDEPHTCAQPQPSPPPRELPFRYAPAAYPCKDSDKHDGTLCVTCEGIIAGIMERRDKDTAKLYDRAQRPEPHRPSDTGMGGACGPVMGRLR